jgi:hypothetical protein
MVAADKGGPADTAQNQYQGTIDVEPPRGNYRLTVLAVRLHAYEDSMADGIEVNDATREAIGPAMTELRPSRNRS